MDVRAQDTADRGPGKRDGERSSASLSLVVPFYNEEDNVEPLVERIHAALAAYPHRWELILVNDGSADATGARMVAALFRVKTPQKLTVRRLMLHAILPKTWLLRVFATRY